MFSIRFFISRYVRSSRPIGAPRSMYLDDFHWFDAFFFADRCCRSIVIVRVTHWWEYHKKWNWKMASGFHEHERLVDMRTLHLKWMQRYMELETNKKKRLCDVYCCGECDAMTKELNGTRIEEKRWKKKLIVIRPMWISNNVSIKFKMGAGDWWQELELFRWDLYRPISTIEYQNESVFLRYLLSFSNGRQHIFGPRFLFNSMSGIKIARFQ